MFYLSFESKSFGDGRDDLKNLQQLVWIWGFDSDLIILNFQFWVFGPNHIFLWFKDRPIHAFEMLFDFHFPHRIKPQKLPINRIGHNEPIHKLILVDNIRWNILTQIMMIRIGVNRKLLIVSKNSYVLMKRWLDIGQDICVCNSLLRVDRLHEREQVGWGEMGGLLIGEGWWGEGLLVALWVNGLEVLVDLGSEIYVGLGSS